MVNADTAPALPWGAAAAPNAVDMPDRREPHRQTGSGTLASEPDHSGDPQVAGLSIGSAIEVKWQLEDEGNTETVWWRASVVDRQPTQVTAPRQVQAVLRYQAFRDIEEETADVVFVPGGYLYHTDSQEALLRWRIEGDQQSDSEEEEEGDTVLDANDLNQDEELLERELGVSAEDVMREQLQRYPLDQQRQLASGARDFVDHFRQKLGQLAQASGGSHTVTENDIQSIFATLRKP